MVERLITAKANVNRRALRLSDPSALHLALKNGHIRVVQRLLEANVAREDVLASFQYAKSKGAGEELTKLLESAAKCGKVD